MAISSFSIASEPLYRLHDSYRIPDSLMVTLNCPNKGVTIRGILSEAINLTATSQWKGWMEQTSGGFDSVLLGGVDTIKQLSHGQTIKQPFFARKLWQGTDPPSIQISLNFFAAASGYENVWRPCAALLSLVYPRNLGNDIAGGLGSWYNIPGPALLYTPKPGGDELGIVIGTVDAITGGMASKVANVVKSVKNLIGKASSLLGGGSVGGGATGPDTDGDNVSIFIGKIVRFKASYITNVTITFSQVMHADGYPMTAVAKFTFEPIDNLYVNSDGTFMEEGLSAKMSAIPGWVRTLSDAAANGADAAVNAAGTIFEGLGNFVAGLVQ